MKGDISIENHGWRYKGREIRILPSSGNPDAFLNLPPPRAKVESPKPRAYS